MLKDNEVSPEMAELVADRKAVSATKTKRVAQLADGVSPAMKELIAERSKNHNK